LLIPPWSYGDTSSGPFVERRGGEGASWMETLKIPASIHVDLSLDRQSGVYTGIGT
jgi:hypothetical protein